MNIFSTILLSVVFLFNVNTKDTTEFTAYSYDIECNDSNNDEDPVNPIIINNANIGIFPGETHPGNKTFIPKTRISPELRDFIVTGIQAADDGTEIVIYATYGNITLLANHQDSSIGNRIEQSSNMTINQGDFAELTYNATIGKWIINSIQ
ncbi:hypothetical protein [uncultured Lacinutrix sp.]|uniref:hypothetical protein n=1 Tax=uncultured Lacinutrix sp. TaxID=574032 RepID=UPI002629D6DC|nr:hypothetical protein [uncultured Lacinutrix sp.]